MTVEYGTSQYSSEKRAAMDKLALTCTSNLRRMQELKPKQGPTLY